MTLFPCARELTYTLLKEDFGLKIEFPLDSLCPAVTVRLNYLHWIEDLLAQRDSVGSDEIRGIDMSVDSIQTWEMDGER